ncbi:hypothetical protein B6U90_04545 [Thermoplasmatales archaeon ex4484_6]|nr:MAG: hypothetical protein B6U90_04545 [Thermoplasmatales archaeon ex4484_6]
MMVDDDVLSRLSDLRNRSPVFKAASSDRIVVASDLHMGDGSMADDFRGNSGLFSEVMSRFYLDRGFKLVLNGDVEELHKFRLKRVLSRWKDIYGLFDRFQDGPGLFKIFGNHDLDFLFDGAHEFIDRQFEAVRMLYMDAELFFLHGHQGSHFLERMHRFNRMITRGFIKPLKLKNFTLELEGKPVTRKENRLSLFSEENGILTFMGHTHRPLFGRDNGAPSLFNSGAVIGKLGMTTLEIERGVISLVHWWDRSLVKRYIVRDWFEPVRLASTGIYRTVLDTASIGSLLHPSASPSF